MAHDDDDLTLWQKIGMGVFVLTIAFCSKEMVPGWEMIGLHLSRETFYVIAGVAGVIGGVAVTGRHWLAGLVGGPLAAIGALFALAWHLDSVQRSYSAEEVFLMLGGTIPGLAIGYLIYFLQLRVKAA